MKPRYPIIGEYDPHQARIGYLGALSLVALRKPDDEARLLTRLEKSLFQKISPEHESFSRLREKIDDEMWRMNLPKEANEKVSNNIVCVREKLDPSRFGKSNLVEKKLTKKTETLSGLWVLDRAMKHNGAWVEREKLSRIIALGRQVGILLMPSYHLSDTGFILRKLIAEKKGEAECFNPLVARLRPALPLLYLRIILQSDCILPIIVKLAVEEIRTRSSRDGQVLGTLAKASKQLLNLSQQNLGFADIKNKKEISTFEAAVSKTLSTEENYLRPRLELLADVGLLERNKGEEKARKWAWRGDETTKRLAKEWNELSEDPIAIPNYLKEKFFGSMNRVFCKDFERVTSFEETLAWAVVGFNAVGRHLGFTSSDTIALYGCLVAWENGKCIEVIDILGVLATANKSNWGKWIGYSGGTRLDNKFMVRFDKNLGPELSTYFLAERIFFPINIADQS